MRRINASTIDGRSKKLLIMDKKLAIMATIKDGLAIALINYLSLILTVVLYFVTIWIPYLKCRYHHRGQLAPRGDGERHGHQPALHF